MQNKIQNILYEYFGHNSFKDGQELMRHEGFFAEGEIDRFLAAQGVRPTG